MSDHSQGADWWIASDGKWYPPESRPDFPISGEAQTAGWASDESKSSNGLDRREVGFIAGIVVLAVAVMGALAGRPESAKVASSGVTSTEHVTTTESPPTTMAPTTLLAPTTTVAPTTSAPLASAAPRPPQPAPAPATVPPTVPPTTEGPYSGETVSQRNARQKAADYLEFMSFSRSGLISQLEYEGFTRADATYGVDALNVDWFEQAAKKAAEYLEFMSFSRTGLIEQLVYEGFTQAQAEYGVGTTGL